eukprot:1282758-Rhodomonas_salina.3
MQQTSPPHPHPRWFQVPSTVLMEPLAAGVRHGVYDHGSRLAALLRNRHALSRADLAAGASRS